MVKKRTELGRTNKNSNPLQKIPMGIITFFLNLKTSGSPYLVGPKYRMYVKSKLRVIMRFIVYQTDGKMSTLSTLDFLNPVNRFQCEVHVPTCYR